MSLFLWKKSYEIGVAEIDVQHRRIVGLINELSDAMMRQQGQRIVGHVIDQLIEYINLHFSTEESAMADAGYPELDQHRVVHVELTEKVRQFKNRVEQDNQVGAKELLDFLCDWFKSHILSSDKEFGSFLSNIQDQPAASLK